MERNEKNSIYARAGCADNVVNSQATMLVSNFVILARIPDCASEIRPEPAHLQVF
jgi:hypothetical protein